MSRGQQEGILCFLTSWITPFQIEVLKQMWLKFMAEQNYNYYIHRLSVFLNIKTKTVKTMSVHYNIEGHDITLQRRKKWLHHIPTEDSLKNSCGSHLHSDWGQNLSSKLSRTILRLIFQWWEFSKTSSIFTLYFLAGHYPLTPDSHISSYIITPPIPKPGYLILFNIASWIIYRQACHIQNVLN